MQAGTTVTTLGCKMVLLAQRFFSAENTTSFIRINKQETENDLCVTMQGEKKTNKKNPKEMKCCLSRGKAGFLLSRSWAWLDMGIGRDAAHSFSHPYHPPACNLLVGWRGRVASIERRGPGPAPPPAALPLFTAVAHGPIPAELHPGSSLQSPRASHCLGLVSEWSLANFSILLVMENRKEKNESLSSFPLSYNSLPFSANSMHKELCSN